MAVSINLQGNDNAQGNPWVAEIGKDGSDAVVIDSGFTAGNIAYEIRRKDRVPMVGTKTVLGVASSEETNETVKAVSAAQLKIVLPLRTTFEVRVRSNAGVWSNWLEFKTRDKTFALPDASTDQRVVRTATSAGERVVVTNVGKATVTTTARGATVVNTDNGYNDVTSAADTRRGATIYNKTIVSATSRGATVTTR